MPRSQNLARYAQEWWEILDQIGQGNSVTIQGDVKQIQNWRNYFNGFLWAFGKALEKPERQPPEMQARLEKYRLVYGQATTKVEGSSLVFLPRSSTPLAVALRQALREGVQEAPRPDLDAEANAALERLQAMKAAREGKVVEDGAPPVSPTLDNPFKRAMG